MPRPTIRGSSQSSPNSATTARCGKAAENIAVGLAKRMSQAAAISTPTPTHGPLIAAMTGLGLASGKV